MAGITYSLYAYALFVRNYKNQALAEYQTLNILKKIDNICFFLVPYDNALPQLHIPIFSFHFYIFTFNSASALKLLLKVHRRAIVKDLYTVPEYTITVM